MDRTMVVYLISVENDSLLMNSLFITRCHAERGYAKVCCPSVR